MKNDYKPDGSAYVPYLADTGAREADYDEQGAVRFKDAKPVKETDYERLARQLYDHAYKHGWPGDHLGGWFAEAGFPELGHAIREGVRDRDKIGKGKWPHGLAKLEGSDEEPKLEGVRIEDNGDIIFEGAKGRELLQSLDPNDFFDGEPTLVEAGKVYKGWESIKSLKPQIDQHTDDWIDHDGGGKPEWLPKSVLVEVKLDDGSYDAMDKRKPDDWYWKKSSVVGGEIVKYRLSEGSKIPNGWRKHDGGYRPKDIAADAKVEVVMRCGALDKAAASQFRWPLVDNAGDIIWYRVISS